ncbi:MAG: flagellar hook basal-body protein [bacterium]
MSTNGLTGAANALRYWELRQEVAANNLANVSTEGFKAERVFARLLDGGPVIGTKTDRSAGTIRETGQATDLAIGGDGFFVVSTAAGERFTRGGSLKIDPAGFLSDQDGNRVLGDKGPIQIGEGTMTVDRRGMVRVDDQVVDRLRIETQPASESLQHEGGTRFIPGTTRAAVAIELREVRQGNLEESNTDSIGGLVDMVSVQRAYAAVEKTIGLLDHLLEVATTQLGRPGN